MSKLKIYCENCGNQPADIDPISKDELNKKPWGDVVCSKCRLVKFTFSADKPGKIVFIED